MLLPTPMDSHPPLRTPIHSHQLPLICNPLQLIFNPPPLTPDIRTVRFTNLSVLIISAFNVSKCFIFLLAPCVSVLACLYVLNACELYVSFLICSVLFFLLFIIYRHILKPQTKHSLLFLGTHPILCSKVKKKFFETGKRQVFDVILIMSTYDKQYFVTCCLLYRLKTV